MISSVMSEGKVDKSAGTLIGLICVHSVQLGWIKWLINAN